MKWLTGHTNRISEPEKVPEAMPQSVVYWSKKDSAGFMLVTESEPAEDGWTRCTLIPNYQYPSPQEVARLSNSHWATVRHNNAWELLKARPGLEVEDALRLTDDLYRQVWLDPRVA